MSVMSLKTMICNKKMCMPPNFYDLFAIVRNLEHYSSLEKCVVKSIGS